MAACVRRGRVCAPATIRFVCALKQIPNPAQEGGHAGLNPTAVIATDMETVAAVATQVCAVCALQSHSR